jgi:hypothetical protein
MTDDSDIGFNSNEYQYPEYTPELNQILIEHGIDTDVSDNYWYNQSFKKGNILWTLLHIAAMGDIESSNRRSNISHMKILLELGAYAPHHSMMFHYYGDNGVAYLLLNATPPSFVDLEMLDYMTYGGGRPEEDYSDTTIVILMNKLKDNKLIIN